MSQDAQPKQPQSRQIAQQHRPDDEVREHLRTLVKKDILLERTREERNAAATALIKCCGSVPKRRLNWPVSIEVDGALHIVNFDGRRFTIRKANAL